MEQFHQIDLEQLHSFIVTAAANTYAGGGVYETVVERPGFNEMRFSDGSDWSYLDSYIGFYRSAGTELVRFQGKPVWYANYGGGMIESKAELADQTFAFLKKAMLAKPEGFSARGPRELSEGDWSYKYNQDGTITDFHGHEEIYFQGELVFWHWVIGGIIVHK